MSAFPRKVLIGSSLLLVAAIAFAQTPRSGDGLKQLARQSLSKINGELVLSGLKQPVEVLRDQWGVPHIYAQNVDDLFYAQGYVTAQDRLWQMESWRRAKQGRQAEILGPAAVAADRNARMTMYRGPMDDREWTSYHPEAKRIFTAYVNGVNDYIKQSANNLPVEFKLTGIKPEPWTPEVLVLRAGGFGDAVNELRLAQDVARLGVKEANRRASPEQWDELEVPEGLDASIISNEVLEALRGGGPLPKPAIAEQYRNMALQALNALASHDWMEIPGSNNWVMARTIGCTRCVQL